MGGSLCFAQGIHFPDANLKNALLYDEVADSDGDGELDSPADLNEDGAVSIDEAKMILGLSLGNREILSLDGLEHFINLEWLHVSNNPIFSIPTTYYPNLKRLIAEYTPLNTLELSQNPALEVVFAGSHPDLEFLDVSNNPMLRVLVLKDSQISSLDLNHNLLLEELHLEDVTITDLDLSANALMWYLLLHTDTLSSIQWTELPLLTSMYIRLPSIDNIEFSGLPGLTHLFIEDTNLINVDLSQNSFLYGLSMSECFTDNLVVEGIKSLEVVHLQYSNIRTVNLSTNPILEWVVLNDINLESLNLQNGNNPNIELFVSQNNPDLTCILIDDVDYSNSLSCDDPLPNWCKDETAVYSEDCTLSIPNHNNLTISLYPNPASDLIQLQTEVPVEVAQIFNLSGQLVLEASTNSIDIHDLPVGLYFLNAQTELGTQTLKFVKR